MALQSAQLTSAITSGQLTFQLTNLSANAQSALPPVGGVPQSIGTPMLIDGEFMYAVSQPVIGTVVVRARGTESAAVAHDTLANVYFSNQPSDFPLPGAAQLTTIDEATANAVSLGQDQTITLPALNTTYNINKATAAAIIVTAPNLGMNGVNATFISNTAAAHVLTATSLINDGTASVPKSTVTFNGTKGASVQFVVENGLLAVVGTPLGVTFS